MKRKRIETSRTDLERSETCGHLQELEQAAKSKNYALMWAVQMKREMANDNQIAQKLLEVEHREMEMHQQLMLHINETQMLTFEKKEFVEAMTKL
ncbi:hypothetical protein Tco_0787854 [Tanacetum coccineum]